MHRKPLVTTATRITRFLRNHLGEMFCIPCLAMKIVGQPRISTTATFEIEGLGAQRHQGRCSVCGEKRLVAVFGAR